jgi:hypothetical protein
MMLGILVGAFAALRGGKRLETALAAASAMNRRRFRDGWFIEVSPGL